MPVALSRFVRVMSGGRVVTDELVDVRQGKVDGEIAKLQAHSDTLTAAGLHLDTVSDSLRDLTAARDDALNLGSNKAICEALELVKFDARQAVDDAGPAVQAALVVADNRGIKLGEVDTALGLLRRTEAAIAVPPCKAAVTPLIGPLGVRRGLLATADTLAAIGTQMGLADALLNDIGAAQGTATNADRAAKLYLTRKPLVDAALQNLRDTELTIAEPAYKQPVTASIVPLAVRAKALADAADLATVTTQTGLATALVKDINTAQLAADKAKLGSDQFAIRTAGMDSWISHINQWMAVLKTGTAGQLILDRDKIVTDRAALATTALDQMDAAMASVDAAINKLHNEVTAEAAKQKQTSADAWPPVFPNWEQRINKITAHNPVPVEVAKLVQEKANADAQVDSGTRRNALDTFIIHAGALQTNIAGMENGKKEIERVGMTVEAILTMTPPPSPGPDALILERSDTLALIPAAFNQTTTDLVITQLGTIKTTMLAVKKKADDWRADQVGLEKLKESVAKSIAAAADAVTKLTPGGATTQLDAAVKALQARKTAIDLLSEAEATKALFALDKEAVALLEKAHKQVFDSQLAAPDGKQKIDDLIKAMNGKAADPQAEAACRAAIAARFNLEVEVLEGLPVDRLPQLYEMFAMVPEDHVCHEKLKKLEYNTDASLSASYYAGTGNKIVLWMPGSEADAPYKPQSGAGATEKLNYFKATTLHEIGHAVDAKQKIMSESRMAGADFGGWKELKIEGVIDAYYTAAFASFVAPSGPTEADLRAFIKSTLETGSCAKPASAAEKLGSLFAKWDEITASTGATNCVKIRNADLSPWDNPVPLGDRAYHEGYTGRWFTYLVASRASGVSDYQWRAPPEWFAELYAYYHMTKKDVPASVKGYIMGTETATT